MIYGDDQCVECGGIRVAKSTLCADCLVKLCNKAVSRGLAQEKEIKRLVKETEMLRKMLDEVITYGFKKNQENVKLKQYIQQLEKQITSSWEDGLW